MKKEMRMRDSLSCKPNTQASWGQSLVCSAGLSQIITVDLSKTAELRKAFNLNGCLPSKEKGWENWNESRSQSMTYKYII